MSPQEAIVKASLTGKCWGLRWVKRMINEDRIKTLEDARRLVDRLYDIVDAELHDYR